jgi:saccharopine dehydrogenase-like NADP-dependent oxidoreductase
LILGCGAQGRVIAADLARSRTRDRITVADLCRPELPKWPNLYWVEADCSDRASTARLMREHDLVVGALPARLGYATMQAAIDARRSLIDVSFAAEDALSLDGQARAAGVTISPDCGLAPGLSHLIAGEAHARFGPPRELTIYVGGMAEDLERPYGYVVTWSLDDLLEEYRRPARIVRGGRPETVPVFSGLERVRVDVLPEMEAFYSDGLRTLIQTLPDVPDTSEKTLRWPGHAEAVQPLVASGGFQRELERQCRSEPPRDLVAMMVRMRWADGRRRVVTLVDRYDPSTGLTAMARTTALTTSVVAQLAAEGGLNGPGVLPLERVGRDPSACEFIVDHMAERGVRLCGRE